MFKNTLGTGLKLLLINNLITLLMSLVVLDPHVHAEGRVAISILTSVMCIALFGAYFEERKHGG